MKGQKYTYTFYICVQYISRSFQKRFQIASSTVVQERYQLDILYILLKTISSNIQRQFVKALHSMHIYYVKRIVRKHSKIDSISPLRCTDSFWDNLCVKIFVLQYLCEISCCSFQWLQFTGAHYLFGQNYQIRDIRILPC